jgi:hypothetical protein
MLWQLIVLGLILALLRLPLVLHPLRLYGLLPARLIQVEDGFAQGKHSLFGLVLLILQAFCSRAQRFQTESELLLPLDELLP